MADWFYVNYKIKPILHILAPLTLWLFVVILLAQEQNNTVMLHLDQVHTYQLQKLPLNYDSVTRPEINKNFNTQWTSADEISCFGQINWTGNSACVTKRNTIVTKTRELMGCDVTRSAGCNCINQVLKAVSNDLTTAGSFTPTGTFLTTGKNLTGQQNNILAAIEACRYLHHPTHLASQTTTGNTLIRRVGLLFLLSTIVTGNAVVYFLFSGSNHDAWAMVMRTIVILIWPAVGMGVAAGIESAASSVVLLITLPPFLILVWCVPAPARAALAFAPDVPARPRRYEFVLVSSHKRFFVHPYFFAVMLATTSVMSLIENSVFDYDNIMCEVWKAHLVSLLYFAVYWFTGKEKSGGHEKDFAYRAQQEALFIALALALLSLLTSAMAPYTSVAYTNYMLWIPLQIALAAFLDVLYLAHADQVHEKQGHEGAWQYSSSTYWISSLILILEALVVIYYWRDYSTIWHAMYENLPTRSIQYNTSYAWLNPVF